MDPLTILSLASSIIQITDFTSKLAKNGYQLYTRGSTDENDDIERVTKDLSSLISSLSATLSSGSSASHPLREEERMLQQLAGDTASTADELVQLLDALSVRGTELSGAPGQRRSRVIRTIKALANQPAVTTLVKKLESYRNELVLRVIVSLKLNADLHEARQNAGFDKLEGLTKKIADDLLANTSYFTTGVSRLRDGQESEAESARIRHEETIAAIATLQGTDATNLSSELTSNSLVDLATIQHEVLDLLWFRSMTDRQEEISAPHDATFQWSHLTISMNFDASEYDLPAWVRSGTGIYWVNGKAGSGKSTFMKHMATHPRTASLLQEWAGEDSPLLCAQFFFWAAGTKLQKSQEGLLRTILHESLSQHPELIPVVFPKHSRLLARRSLTPGDPSLAELKAAFSILVAQRIYPLHICLFIDGMDEYDGDHIEFVEYLSKAVSSTVKLVLSSRPTPSCVEAFNGSPSIRLQDFTRRDIVSFVRRSLLSSRSLAVMWSEKPAEVLSLFQEVVNKASGVFLWVILVVKALRRAADDLDSIADLRARVAMLPADLDKLYADMLAKMDPLHRRQAAMLLQIMYQSTQIQSKKPMEALRLSFAMEDEGGVDTAIDAEIRPLTVEEKQSRRQAMSAMIRSRCCGLLETSVRPHVPATRKELPEATRNGLEAILKEFRLPVEQTRGDFRMFFPVMPSRLNEEENVEGDSSVSAEAETVEVHFLHKSVIDFLEQPQVWETLNGFLGSRDFNAARALAVASLRELKAAPPETDLALAENNEPSLVWDTLKRAFHECVLAERLTGDPQELLLETIDEVMDHHWRYIGGWRPNFSKSLDEMGHWSYQFDCGSGHCQSMFQIACLSGLHGYISQVLEDDPRLAQQALEHVIVNVTMAESGFPVDIIELCLKHGADVNRLFYKGMSSWQVALARCNPVSVRLSEDMAIVLSRMVDAGADVSSGLEEVYFVFKHDENFRIRRSPLEVLRDRFLAAMKSQTRQSSSRRIEMAWKKIQRHIIQKGGVYQYTVEKQVGCHDSRDIIWRLADSVMAKEVYDDFNEYSLLD